MIAKVAINGFGRIGRLFFRSCYNNPHFDFVAINDLTDAKTLAHLLKYDSVHGTFDGAVSYEGNTLIVNGKKIPVTAYKELKDLNWAQYKTPDSLLVVVEATGVFRDPVIVATHCEKGADKVIITAPSKKNNPDATIVMGVNENHEKTGYKKSHKVISNASCTTNALAPIVKVIHERFKITKGFMTTIHSYTNDQRILDLPHSDLRRARAAALSMIPTTTGAATAIGKVLPDLKGKLDGIAIRVPTSNVSVVDLVVETESPCTAAEINQALKEAAQSPEMSKYLQFSEEPLVSVDFNHNSHSSIVDAEYTKHIEGTHMIKVMAWYDNEWGYSCRITDLIEFMLQKEAE